MYCKQCGRYLDDGVTQCPSCGATTDGGNAAQPQYTAVNYSAPQMEQPRTEPPVTLGQWLITMLLTCIPFVGFILLFVWAFSSGTNTSKKNWARASLIFALIVIVIYIIAIVAFVAIAASMSFSTASVGTI